MQVSVIVMLTVLSLEIVDFSETFKGVRPYKYFSPRPWRPPRWHPRGKTQKRFHAKRRPPHKYRPYESDRHRYAPHYEDYDVDIPDNDKPYIIVIQLPQRKEKRKKRPYERVHVVKPSEYKRETDYINDDDDADYDGDGDSELKVYKLNDNKVQIKVNDRLSVLTS
ncbi:PREDICTED: uncharacterized protein LOC106740866 [Dinoponera quadriceps]|uniref:Uncharacterized protein LOC106740866 n=1 Tax=Dinoponera quadriceps TaxID=609295 RepID=A0A6P3WP37_DINQU|nr:PREDICTED: uncharacterized protein LOC106740866 [Dinoponera quadriceps]